MTPPRIALGAFMLESNAHSPIATRAEFAANYLAYGQDMIRDLESAAPIGPKTLSGFFEAMNAAGPWKPVPLMGTAVGASDLAQLPLVGAIETGGFPWDMALRGHYAIVAEGPSGLQIIDASDPNRTRRMFDSSWSPWSAETVAKS